MNTTRNTLLLAAAVAALAAPRGGPADCRAKMYVYGYSPNVNDRFNNSPNFLGAGYNFSGVGNVNAPYNSNQIGPWGTMISDQYFISATHFAPGPSSANPTVYLQFYSTNSTSGAYYTATVSSLGQAVVDAQGNTSDVWLGKLTAPIPTSADITPYPIAYSPTGNYTGVNVYMYGSPDLLGYNQVSGTEYSPVNNEYGKFFDWSPTGATNQSYGVSGDSGGPQFAVVNGSLALLGGTTFPTAATLIPHYLQQIEALTGGQVATVALTIPGVYSWTGATSSDWNTGGNWSTSTSPTSSDTVSFNGSTPNTSVSLSSTGNTLNIDFDGGVGYTVGATNGPALNLAAGGSINIVGNMDTASQTVNAPIVLAGNGEFSNDAVSNSNTLAIGGGITGTAASGNTDTLTLTGTNAGANAVNGIIGNGSGGGNVAVTVAGGSWSLGGTNTYSGGATVENGATLEYTNTAAFGSGTINVGVSGNTAQESGTLVAGVGGTLANNITSAAPIYTQSDVFNTNGVTTNLTGIFSGQGFTITGGGTLILSNAHNGGQLGEIVNGGSTLEVASGGYFGNGYLELNAGTFVLGAGVSTNVGGLSGGTSSKIDLSAAGTHLVDLSDLGSVNYSGSVVGSGSLTVNREYSFANGSTTFNGTNGLVGFTGILGLNYDAVVNVSTVTGLAGNAVEFTGGAYNGGAAATTETLNFTGGSVALGAVSMAIGNPWGNGFTGSSAVNTIDAGGAANILMLSGSITSAAGGNNTLILQNGIFDLTGTSSSSFAAGTLQIGNGTGTSVVQFAAATNLPATNVGITLNDGTLQYGAASLTVANNLTLTGNGAIDTNGFGDPSSGETYSGNITGSGNLTILSSVAGGEVYLTGNNSAFTGNTTLENGVEVGISTSTAFGNGIVSIGTGGGTVEYDAAVTVNNNLVLNNGVAIAGINMHGEAGTWAGAISGTNGLLVHDSLGGGTLTLTNANNSYSGATSIGLGNAVTLALAGSGSIANSSGVSIASGGTFDISGTTSGTSIVSLGGVSGSIVALGGQTLTITDAAMGANGTFGGVIGGTGGGLTLLAGTETLSSNNTYSGGTTINGGVLSISSDANLGATTGAVTLGGGTLNYTGASGTLANPITVSGSSTTSTLENSGSGTETLTGAITNSTASNTLAFSGGTFNLNEVGLGAGTFQIGDAPSTVIVSNPNAFGSGAILLTTGSTLETSDAATNSGMPININGSSYTQQSASTLTLRATSSTTYDSIQLGGGKATLNGELNLIFSGFTPQAGQKYVVIGTTGTVAGNFSSIVLSGAPRLKSMGSFVLGTGEVIDLSYIAFFGNLSGFTPNQTAVANYLNTNAIGPNTPPAITNALNSMSLLPVPQQAAYLNELTPQAYSQLQNQSIINNTFLAQEVFGQVQNAFEDGGFNTSGLTLLKTNDQNPFAVSMDAAMQSAQQQAKNSTVYMDAPGLPQPIIGMSGSSPAVPARESYRRLSGFVLGTVALDQLPQQDGGATQHFTTGGILAGLDYRLNRHLMVGALFNYGYTGGTMDNVGSQQQSSSYTPGVFVGYNKGGFYADGLMSYTYNSYKINRNIDIPGSSSTATGKPDSNEYDANALLGYYLPITKGFKIGPAAGVGFTQVNTSGFSETGSPFDLSVSKKHADSLRSLLGMQGQLTIAPVNDPLPINISFNAFWQHEFLNSASTTTASFSELGGSGSFIYNNAGPSARNSALVGLGVNGYIAKQVSLFVNYEAQIGTNSQIDQTVMAGVAVNF